MLSRLSTIYIGTNGLNILEEGFNTPLYRLKLIVYYNIYFFYFGTGSRGNLFSQYVPIRYTWYLLYLIRTWRLGPVWGAQFAVNGYNINVL